MVGITYLNVMVSGAEGAKKMEAVFGALDDACETLRLIEVREEQER